jgi:hypothetical protein
MEGIGMERHEIQELFYITPIANVPSILRSGILSHRRAAALPHTSIAMVEIQNRRQNKIVPNGRPLHDYVNLYFNPRNPMMFSRQEKHRECCILQIDLAVLDLVGTVITDRNAAAGYAAFRPAPTGLAIVDRGLTFAEYWTHDNPIEHDRRKTASCAEVLVPDGVSVTYLRGAHVSGPEAETALTHAGFQFPIRTTPKLFFLR